MTLRSVFADATDAVRGYWQGPISSSDPGLASFFGPGARTVAGVNVTEDSSLSYAPVWNAVRLVAGHLGSLPLHFYKRTSAGKERFEGHPLYRLLHAEANPELSADEFREISHAHALLWGNAYAEISRNGAGQPTQLWPIHPSRVQPFRGVDSRGRLGPMQYRIDGETVIQSPDMLHIRGLGSDGMIGYSVIAMARQNLGLGIAAEQFGASFYGNGSTFGGILTHPGKLTRESKQGIRESIESTHQGPAKAHKFIVLGEGMTYATMGIPPNEAQFLESRVFQVRDVARWFNIPPSKLGDLADATYSNTEQANIAYVVDCLGPWLVRWEQALLRQLVASSERSIQLFKFNVNGLLRGDSQSRSELYSKLFNIGVMSINDIREAEDLNSIGPDGDRYFVPVNLQSAEFAGEKPESKMAPAPPVEPKRDADPIVAAAIAELRTITEALGVKQDETVTELRLLPSVLADVPKAVAAESARATAEAEVVRLRESLTATEAERDEARTNHEQTAIELATTRTAAEAAVALQVETEAKRTAAETTLIKREQELTEVRLAVADLRFALDESGERLEDRAQVLEQATTALRQAEAAAETARTEAETAQQAAERAQTEATTAAEKLTAAEQAVSKADAARAAADIAAADAIEATKAAEAIAAQARQDALQAQQDAEAVRAEADAAKQATAAAETARQAAEEARQQVQDALTAQQQAVADRDAGVLGAFRLSVVDVWRKVVRKEMGRARQNQLTPAKLRAWSESFYELHEDTCVEALRPVLRPHLAWLGSTADVDDVARALIGPQLTTAVQQIRAVADSHPDDYSRMLERVLTKWESERPDALGDLVLKEGITHVRTR